jgi:hypothetical protein
MFARFRDGCTRPRDIALNHLLVDYTKQLAADIDGHFPRAAFHPLRRADRGGCVRGQVVCGSVSVVEVRRLDAV